MKKVAFWAFLTLLILFTSASSFNILRVKAWAGDITIRSDGSVDPPTAPINQIGNLYSLTDDVQGSITIEEDNIIVNGMGHAIQWTGTNPIGVNLGSRTNVTIMNIVIANFVSGVYLYSSSHNNISQNNITGNNGYGIYIYSSSNNDVLGNTITANSFGVFLDSSSNNNILQNKIKSNSEGVYCQNSANNEIFQNNFKDNTEQTHAEASANVWDAGYPSGGNYWNDYNGTDQRCGPNQDHPGHDGIGDVPYTIDSNNRDNYPLMNPWTPPTGHEVAIIALISYKTVVGQGYSSNIAVCGANKGAYSETFNVAVYGNTTQIASTTVPLGSGSTTTLTFSWNTISVSKGNYIASAYAQPVPNETNTADNNYTGSWISVSIPGDVNGDFKVSLSDLVLLANAYGTTPASEGISGEVHAWNPNADIDNNSIVGLIDLVILANHYGQP